MHCPSPALRRLLSCVLLVLAAGGLILAPAEAEAPPDPAPAPQPHPLLASIQNLLAEKDRQLEGLEEQRTAAPDFAARLVVEKRMQQVKVETERAILLLQLRHAEEQGAEATARRLRATLGAIDELGRRQALPTAPEGESAEGEVAP